MKFWTFIGWLVWSFGILVPMILIGIGLFAGEPLTTMDKVFICAMFFYVLIKFARDLTE